ncbi:hypothetical protein BRARA_D00156 [Brassica rapa]|uniref:GRF-type domain-containing protein n=1 Tax=Brassica campestris TaxID=3711 RepID=A0A397ZGZ3_BRACM|nr:hypothetical protein BRARA_D00156 [Brassica rapa]CAG7905272.1 unnamed protein product [Brassica rapa]
MDDHIERGGIPRKFECGAPTIMLESKTAQNPGRRFYRCGKIYGPNHVFMWLDEAHHEELGILGSQQAMMAKDLIEIKTEIGELKKDICEIIEFLESFRSNLQNRCSFVSFMY